MGITYIDGDVRGTNGESVTVHFLVDSGATSPVEFGHKCALQ